MRMVVNGVAGLLVIAGVIFLGKLFVTEIHPNLSAALIQSAENLGYRDVKFMEKNRTEFSCVDRINSDIVEERYAVAVRDGELRTLVLCFTSSLVAVHDVEERPVFPLWVTKSSARAAYQLAGKTEFANRVDEYVEMRSERSSGYDVTHLK